jgi:hypothetical protein
MLLEEVASGHSPIFLSDVGARHNKMDELVEGMLDLHKQLPEAKTPHEQESLQRQIAVADNQIDALVYELYGLTEEEIEAVEG